MYLRVPLHIWCGSLAQHKEEESHRSEIKIPKMFKNVMLVILQRLSVTNKYSKLVMIVIIYPVISVNVYSVSEKRLNNVHITSRAGQRQGTFSLPRDCIGVCTLKTKQTKKSHKHLWDGTLCLNNRVFPDSSQLISNLLQEIIHHCFLSKRRCPHERCEAPFILSAEQRAVCKITKKTGHSSSGGVVYNSRCIVLCPALTSRFLTFTQVSSHLCDIALSCQLVYGQSWWKQKVLITSYV